VYRGDGAELWVDGEHNRAAVCERDRSADWWQWKFWSGLEFSGDGVGGWEHLPGHRAGYAGDSREPDVQSNYGA
ncbi:MAG: hypothetical protein LC775_09235, partial [Acidobacteria bacterium]|nr:hypothetical protein [Acidobacteriota bacterium]